MTVVVIKDDWLKKYKLTRVESKETEYRRLVVDKLHELKDNGSQRANAAEIDAQIVIFHIHCLLLLLYARFSEATL
jgi:hypothetical protein